LFDGDSRIIGGRLLASNIFGKSIIANLTCSEIIIFYGDNSLANSQHDHSLTIHNYDAFYYEYSSDGFPQQEYYLPSEMYIDDLFPKEDENPYDYYYNDQVFPNHRNRDDYYYYKNLYRPPTTDPPPLKQYFIQVDEPYTLPAIIDTSHKTFMVLTYRL